MRCVLQRVLTASVEWVPHGSSTPVVRSIGPGILALAAFLPSDTESEILWMAQKIPQIRIFPDEAGKMNRSLLDIGGELLIVSQFTLYADAAKGTRPSFDHSAPGNIAQPLYERFVECARKELPGRVQTGEFGAAMKVSLLNDGPVTLILDRDHQT